MHGSVHVLDKEFEPISSWVAHVGGRVTHMVERRGYLVTLGVSCFFLPLTYVLDNIDVEHYRKKTASRNPLLKIWHLEKTDKHGAPTLLRSTKVQTSNRPHPVRLPNVLFTPYHVLI
jgi:hypothetical protein